MAKKYEQQRYDGLYDGSAQSLPFSPLKAVDESKRYEQKFKELNRDLDTESKHLARTLKVQTSQLSANKAKSAANAKAFQGLLSIAGKAVDTFGNIHKLNENQKRQNEADAKRAETEAREAAVDVETNNFLFGGETPIVDGAVEQEESQSIQSQTVGAIAQEVEVETGDPQLGEDIRQPAADGQAARANNAIGTHEAAARIGADLEDFMLSDEQITLPDGRTIFARDARTSAELSAVASEGVRRLSKGYGLAGMDPKVLRSTYLGAARGAFSNAIRQRGAVTRKAAQGARAEAFFTEATSSMRAGTTSLQDTYHNLYRNLKLANVSIDPTKLNELARNHVIAVAEGMGPAGIALLEDLKKVEQVPGNAGTALGKGRFAGDIDKAITRIRTGAVQKVNLENSEGKARLLNLQQEHQKLLLAAQTEEERIKINQNFESQLKELAEGGSLEAQQTLTSELSKDNRFDPLAVGELMDRIAAGDTLSDVEIQELEQTGTITSEQAKAVRQAAGITTEKVESLTKPYKTEWTNQIKGTVNTALAEQGVDASSAELAGVVGQLDGELNKHMASWIARNPRADSTLIRQEAQRYVQSETKSRLQGVKFENGVVTGFKFGVSNYKNPTTGQKSRVLTNFETKDIVALNQDSDKSNDIDAYNDRLLTKDEFKAALVALQSGNVDNMPARVKDLAEAANMTPRNLVYAQGVGQGIDVDAAVRSTIPEIPPESAAAAAAPVGPGQVNSLSRGTAYLRTQGFSRKGAAYLAGNIQQESSWNGQRQPWDDGGAPAGGLVSWRGDRLQNIEAHLNKPISQATNEEQLAAMVWEMKTNPLYADAYRTFNNPNATDAQLRRASYQYWGWGDEGDRFSYAQQALQTSPEATRQELSQHGSAGGGTPTAGVPYINQLSAANGEGGRQCFSAVSTMLANAYGIQIDYNSYNNLRAGFGDTILSSSQTGALGQLGLSTSVADNGSLTEVASTIKSTGKPVAIGVDHNGGGGHWILVTGVTPEGDFIVNDPYGKLVQQRFGGWAYTNRSGNTGEGVVYRRDFLYSIFEDRGAGTGRIMRVS